MHHGYQWLDKRDFWLSGTVRSVYYGNPHITFRMESQRDGMWLIELTDVLGAELVGLKPDTIRSGAWVTVYGHRSRQPNDRRMRGDKLQIGGMTYIVFPKHIFGLGA